MLFVMRFVFNQLFSLERDTTLLKLSKIVCDGFSSIRLIKMIEIVEKRNPGINS